jgi:VanZ family protein
MAAIFVLSAQSDLDSGLGVLDLVLRKLGHAFAFGSLTVLWWWTLRPLTRNPLPAAAGIALLYAISDEYHQSFVEGRHGSAVDVVVDAIGIVVAVLALRYDPRVRSVLERYGGVSERRIPMSRD